MMFLLNPLVNEHSWLENPHFQWKYITKGSIFQPAMLAYQRVSLSPPLRFRTSETSTVSSFCGVASASALSGWNHQDSPRKFVGATKNGGTVDSSDIWKFTSSGWSSGNPHYLQGFIQVPGGWGWDFWTISSTEPYKAVFGGKAKLLHEM